MWFDPGLAGLFITSTLLHLKEDINLLVVSDIISLNLIIVFINCMDLVCLVRLICKLVIIKLIRNKGIKRKLALRLNKDCLNG